MNHQIYTSSGNLIISGEYFVLTGAKALAVPLRFGQEMSVKTVDTQNKILGWEVYELSKPWFSASFNCEDLKILKTNHPLKAIWLKKALEEVRSIKPGFLLHKTSLLVTCNIHFRKKWGWGSSATFINNLSDWAGTDPFILHKLISNGSGYDVAASRSDNPIIYQLKNGSGSFRSVDFNPPFKDLIYFIYTGRKQNTATSLRQHTKSLLSPGSLVSDISDLTRLIASAKKKEDFKRYIVEHEKIISATIKMPRIKDRYFSDLDGEVKSLGAWGGDFAMVLTSIGDSNVRQYFKNKGLNTLFKFDEIIKNKDSSETGSLKQTEPYKD